MKKLILFLVLAFPLAGISQTLRYFEFTTGCNYGDWRDSSFIACTSDTALINRVLAEISNPTGKIISGNITHGHGGHNHNAGHWFSWHFIPGQWTIQDLATEVCDGCPRTDVDNDTAYWIGTVGSFCPWSSQVKREVPPPTGISPVHPGTLLIYPNPAKERLFFADLHLAYPSGEVNITLYNITGRKVLEIPFTGMIKQGGLDISALPAGIYLLKVKDNTGTRELNCKVVKE